MKSNKKTGFTLAEVLITLAIIGVVAAISIPSVISNSQQQEFKTGLRKAVSVLNSAITMNMALDGESPYDNANLMGFLMKHMAIVETTDKLLRKFYIASYSDGYSYTNAAFYTTDGMRFEFRTGGTDFAHLILYENSDIHVCMSNVNALCGGCGSYGLKLMSTPPALPIVSPFEFVQVWY